MFKKIVLLTISIAFIALSNINPVFADPPAGNQGAIRELVEFSIEADIHNTKSPIDITITWINITLGFIGLIFLIMIIYSGVQWMTSAGNEEKITKAKQRIINSVIGVVIILLSYAIANWIMTTIQNSADQSSNWMF
jgi:lysylphosphatidylglycerol synthetase-like protein (DUF2156 family)